MKVSFEISSVNIIYDVEPVTSKWLRDLLMERGIRVYYEIEKSQGSQFTSFPDKVIQWAEVGNQCLELALSHNDRPTHLAWIEADLSYPYDTIEVLLDRDKPIIAPLVYLNNTFYDSWGFRDKNGQKFTAIQPTTPSKAINPVEIQSVGSFVVFETRVFTSGIRFKPIYEHGLLVGICEDAAEIGIRTFMEPTISILHPTTAWYEQIWGCVAVSVHTNDSFVCEYKLDPVVQFAGPYEEMFRGWLDQALKQNHAALGPGIYSIVRNNKMKTFEVRVDFSPPLETMTDSS